VVSVEVTKTKASDALAKIALVLYATLTPVSDLIVFVPPIVTTPDTLVEVAEAVAFKDPLATAEVISMR
jgi:hypothetical protein